MCAAFGWPADFWRAMGWCEFWCWHRELGELNRSKRADPESWDGAQGDDRWEELRASRDRARGRR